MKNKDNRYSKPRKTFSWKSHSYGKFALCLLFFYGKEVYTVASCGNIKKSDNFHSWLKYTFPAIFDYYEQKLGIKLEPNPVYQRFNKMDLYETENPNNTLNKDYVEMSFYYGEICKRYYNGTRVFDLPTFEDICKKLDKYLGKLS